MSKNAGDNETRNYSSPIIFAALVFILAYLLVKVVLPMLG